MGFDHRQDGTTTSSTGCYVWAGSLGSDTGTLAGLQQGLADLGYVEG
jgi:hypothetical protein